MPKAGQIFRYAFIYRKVKANKYITYTELEDAFYTEMESVRLLYDEDISFSKRTLSRNIRDMSMLFDIQIKYNFKERGYELLNPSDSQVIEGMLNSHILAQTLNLSSEYSDYIQLETRKAQGYEHIAPLLDAIKSRKEIEISYQKFYAREPEPYTLWPLLIKESQGRMYLIAIKTGKMEIRHFGLDRLLEISFTNKKYPKQDGNLIDFSDAFGIINPDDQHVEKVVLRFEQFQSNYIKTKPLHHSQTILEEDGNYAVMELNPSFRTLDKKLQE